jgi:spore germination protein GerM
MPGTTEPSSPAVDACGDPETAPTPGVDTVLVYFTCGTFPIAPVYAVARPGGGSTEERLEAAIGALLEGPTAAEVDRGLRSWFSATTSEMLNGAAVADGIAIVDFADFSSLIPNASTTAGRRELLSQIQATAFQFAEVESLEIQFDASCQRFWTWLGAPCMRMDPPAAP